MATTGVKLPSSGTSVARSTATAWTNPGNITADDGTVASITGGATGSAYLVGSNFGFAIPTNSVINGVRVIWDVAESSAGTEVCTVQLQNETGALFGVTRSFTANGTALTLYTVGSLTDLWGATLTPAIVNDVDFGVRMWFITSHNITVDYVSVEIDYTPPNTGSLSAKETGSDTFTSSGKVVVKGSLSVSEIGSDTFSASGLVKSISTGTLAATETGSDTFVSTGKVLVKGSLSASETGSDTFVSTGKVVVKGSLSAIEIGSDTLSATGKVLVKGSLSATEIGLDAFNASGKVYVQGSLQATEVGLDVAVFTGVVISGNITGSMAANEEGFDIANFNGIQEQPKSVGGGGLIKMSASRRDLVSTAEKMLRLLQKPIIKNTLKITKVSKKLEEVIEQVRPKAKTLETLADQAITELINQQKIVKNVENARKIRAIIEDLKQIKNDVEDEEEALMMLFG